MYVFSVCALCVCLRESVLSSHGLHSGDPTCVFNLGSKRLYPRTVSPSYLGALLSPRSIAYPREWGMSEHPFPKICGRNRIPGPCPTPARLTQSFTVRMGGTESRHVASRLQKCLGSTCSREPPSLRRKEESCCEAVQFIDNSKLPSLTLGGGVGGGDKKSGAPKPRCQSPTPASLEVVYIRGAGGLAYTWSPLVWFPGPPTGSGSGSWVARV